MCNNNVARRNLESPRETKVRDKIDALFRQSKYQIRQIVFLFLLTYITLAVQMNNSNFSAKSWGLF